jgi:hypothetical protein
MLKVVYFFIIICIVFYSIGNALTIIKDMFLFVCTDLAYISISTKQLWLLGFQSLRKVNQQVNID